MKVKNIILCVLFTRLSFGADNINSSDPKDHERVKALQDELAVISNSKKSFLDYFKFWESDEENEAQKQAEIAAKQAELENAMREAGTLTEVSRSIGEGDNKISLSISLVADEEEKESYALDKDPKFSQMRGYIEAIRTGTSPIAIFEQSYSYYKNPESAPNYQAQVLRRLIGTVEALSKFQTNIKGIMIALDANLNQFIDNKLDLRVFYFGNKYLELEEMMQVPESQKIIEASEEMAKQREFFMKNINELKSYLSIVDDELKAIYEIHGKFLKILDERLKQLADADFPFEKHQILFVELFSHRRKLNNLLDVFVDDLNELGELGNFLKDIFESVEAFKASEDYKLTQMSKRADELLSNVEPAEGEQTEGEQTGVQESEIPEEVSGALTELEEPEKPEEVIQYGKTGANDEEYFRKKEEKAIRTTAKNDIIDALNSGETTMESIEDASITTDVLESERLDYENANSQNLRNII